ncbi:MAG: 30S ribosomal protein S20 [Clostridia bacterium]
MPNIKSAVKRVKTTRVRTLRNASAKSSLKTAVKKYEAQLSQGDRPAAEAALRKALSAIDKAEKKGVIHKNQAARRKSRLTKRLAALSGAPEAPSVRQ